MTSSVLNLLLSEFVSRAFWPDKKVAKARVGKIRLEKAATKTRSSADYIMRKIREWFVILSDNTT